MSDACSTMRRAAERPARCPAIRGKPRRVAHRPLPSMMMAICNPWPEVLCIVEFPFLGNCLPSRDEFWRLSDLGWSHMVFARDSSAHHRERTVPINAAREVHGGSEGKEAGNRPDEQCVIFEAKQHIDQSVQQREDDQCAQRLNTAGENPAGVCRQKNHGGAAGKEKS